MIGKTPGWFHVTRLHPGCLEVDCNTALNAGCNVCQVLHYVQSPPDKKPELLESARTADDVWVMLKSVKIWLKIVATIRPDYLRQTLHQTSSASNAQPGSIVRIEMEDAAQDVWHLDTWKLLDQTVTFSEQSMQLNDLIIFEATNRNQPWIMKRYGTPAVDRLNKPEIVITPTQDAGSSPQARNAGIPNWTFINLICGCYWGGG